MVDPPAFRTEPDPGFADRLERLLLTRLVEDPRRDLPPDHGTGAGLGGRSTDRSEARSRPRRWVLGVAAAVLLTVVGAVMWRDDGGLVEVATSPTDPSGARGGRWFALAAGPFGRADIYLLRGEEAPRRVDLPGSDAYHEVCPAFAPQTASPGSGAQRLMVGRATREESELVIVEVDGSGSVSPTLTIPLDGVSGVPCPIWSPDGRWAAVAGGGAVWVVNTNSGDARQLPGYNPTDLEWRPGTDELAITGHRADLEDPATDTPIDIYTVSTGETRNLGAARATHLTWSPDGTTLAFTHDEEQPDSGIWLTNADGTDQRQLTERLGVVLHGTGVTWSPRGDVIAYMRCEGEPQQLCSGEGHEVVLVTAIGEDGDDPVGTETVIAPARTTAHLAEWYPYNITWSPDGTHLVYFAWMSSGTVATTDETNGVIAVPTDGAEEPTVVFDELDPAIGTDDLGVYDGTPWIPLQPWSQP